MNKRQRLAVAAAIIVKDKKINKRRVIWAKDWLLRRKLFTHVNLLTELKVNPGDCYNYLRMDETMYLELLNLVTPLIERENTHLREAICPHERLTATLRYLAAGRSYEDLKFSTVISAQTLGRIIPETCSAIYRVLSKEYLMFPSSEDEWKAIAIKFEERWNFPNCLGCVDGKHIQIIPPPNVGSYFWNYKGTNSLVLMPIANANYEFIMVDFGANGRLSDGEVIENTLFFKKLILNELKNPQPSKPSNSDRCLPYVFLGDEAFAVRDDFVKPYSQKELDREKRIFNYRLSRAHRIIENAFGMLVSKFRIFRQPINLKLENIEKVAMACCVLHNYLRRKGSDNDITATNNTNNNETFRLIDLKNSQCRHASKSSTQIRNMFKEYFNNEGAVPWQENHI